MININTQSIENGSNNIQANGNVTVNNYYGDYRPGHIEFYEKNILELIDHFNQNIDLFEEDDYDNPKDNEFENVDKTKKNELNVLSEEYFQEICNDFLPFFYKIDDFLKTPMNKDILKKYRRVARALKFSIESNRKNFNYFEEILNDIHLTIVRAFEKENHEIEPDLVIVFLNYMYWNCDIGRREKDAGT